MNKYHKQIKKKNRYKEFIRVLNGLLNLTQREGDILNTLFLIQEDYTSEMLKRKGLLNATTRKTLMVDEHLTKSYLSKVEHGLLDKGALLKTPTNKVIINPIFRPVETDKGLRILFILDYENEDESIII